ncbi:MAG: glycine--tRNA ligase subunit alpha [bacterium JZ-2024 1]
MDLSQLLEELNRFWRKHGCVILTPYDVEMGAGTMHPGTFFPCLGPQPARVAYPQPCRRPADARYGDNPNRLGYYYQYQVILKPSPDDVRLIYLKSLEYLGIDLKQHDIRFMEDDWESPTLGAWGIGWEVWLDGMEITQFTYFQQVAGLDLFPIPVEITYGVERLGMFLQKKYSIFDLEWSAGKTYGELWRESERQFSRFYFELADADEYRNLLNSAEKEARKLLEKGLFLPAYDHVLKMSHLFNILDARGAVSPLERAQLMKRIRTLAQQVAHCYLSSAYDPAN